MTGSEPNACESGFLAPPPLKIGALVIDPPVLQAPMAGFTNHVYRRIIRQLGGVGLPATEMVHACGFLEIDARTGRLPERLWGVYEEPRPLAVQIWDNDPDVLARAGARLAGELGVSVIDVNFGCPVKAVTARAQSGSYLLAYPERVGRIVARVVEACRPTPVTAKIRLGLTRDSINAVDLAQAVEGAGAAALTVHGRTAEEMFRGTADWGRIARIKPHLRHIPLIGNGDLTTPEAAACAFRRYDVDGVMIGRAALARPWLFRQVEAALAGESIPPDPTPAEQRRLLLDHYRLMTERFGERRGTILMRRYACCYAQGRRGARSFRRQASQAKTPDELIAAIDNHFKKRGRSSFLDRPGATA